jgi:catechol 2,3-dioxygenase-like lactoylglutathione lyase family enzyme
VEVERADFVSVPVADLERARRFYEETLQLPRVAGPGAWPEFALGNVSLYLVEPERMGVETWSPHAAYIALRVADVAGARAELEAKGVVFEGPIRDSGVCHMAFFRDPDGNALMLHRRYASPSGDGAP